MNTPRTAAASAAAQKLISMGIDRRAMGLKSLLLVIRTVALTGQITEPESKILLGKTGMLKKFSNQGYLKQTSLPPGLKAAPHFPHEHYYQLTDMGYMLLAANFPEFPGYGNSELKVGMYLHDFVARIEAAWRIRTCMIHSYIAESRLPDLAAPSQKQHDGHFVLYGGERTGLEVELSDIKAGDKLSRFAAQCLNSITNNRVQGIQILVQTESNRCNYAKHFEAGQKYCAVWVKENGRWVPRQSSETIITPELAAKVRIDLILSEQEIAEKLRPQSPIWLPSAIAWKHSENSLDINSMENS